MPEAIKITVRLPEPVKAWLAARAKQNRRAMNSEILVILEKEKGEAKSTIKLPSKSKEKS